MPIDNIPRRFRELGRLKFGEDLGDRPTQLRTWRLTSPNLDLIWAAARLWGGQPGEPRANTQRDIYEVTTEAEELEVLVPLQDVAAGQWWEHWTAGGLQRRCSGTALVEFDDNEPDGWRKVAPCVCEDENGPRICKPTTVLRVLLPQLPDLGVWRLTTRSIYAAQELPVAVGYLLGSHPDRTTAPAVLGLDHRSSKKPGQGRHDFTVPVLRVHSTLEALGDSGSPEALTSAGGQAPKASDGSETASLPAAEPGPEILPVPPPDAASLAPSADPGPTTPETPDPADTGEIRRSETRQALRDYLDGLDLANIGHDRDELLELLDEIERLAVAAGIWEPGALDLAADRWVETSKDDWRQAPPYSLHTFAQRAVLALGKEQT